MNDYKCLISLIVPVYNQEKYIERCLNSILVQTYQKFEVIIIDDGSNDKSAEICDKYGQKDKRFRIFHIKNAGVSNARNIGMKKARGEYITFLDSDDTLHREFLFTLLEHIKSTNCQIAISGFFRVFDNSTKAEDLLPYTGIVNVLDEFDYSYNYTFRHIWGALYNRKIIEGEEFATDLYVGEDSLFMSKMILKSPKICFVNKCLYNYFCLEESSSHGIMTKKKATVCRAWERIIMLYHRSGCKKKFMNGIYISYIEEVINGCRNLYAKRKRDKLYSIYMKSAKKQVFLILSSGLSIKNKIMYLFFLTMPGLYFEREDRKVEYERRSSFNNNQ